MRVFGLLHVDSIDGWILLGTRRPKSGDGLVEVVALRHELLDGPQPEVTRMVLSDAVTNPETRWNISLIGPLYWVSLTGQVPPVSSLNGKEIPKEPELRQEKFLSNEFPTSSWSHFFTSISKFKPVGLFTSNIQIFKFLYRTFFSIVC